LGQGAGREEAKRQHGKACELMPSESHKHSFLTSTRGAGKSPRIRDRCVEPESLTRRAPLGVLRLLQTRRRTNGKIAARQQYSAWRGKRGRRYQHCRSGAGVAVFGTGLGVGLFRLSLALLTIGGWLSTAKLPGEHAQNDRLGRGDRLLEKVADNPCLAV
jgi:hypothetical protein